MINSKSKFKWGLVVGAVLGGAAAYFLNPRTGKENREMAKQKLTELQQMMKEKGVDQRVQDIFGKVTEEGKRLYDEARMQLSARLDEMKTESGEIDYSKYKELVMQVLARLRDEKDATQDRLSNLQDYLLNRWDNAKNMAEDDVKKLDEGDEKKQAKK